LRAGLVMVVTFCLFWLGVLGAARQDTT